MGNSPTITTPIEYTINYTVNVIHIPEPIKPDTKLEPIMQTTRPVFRRGGSKSGNGSFFYNDGLRSKRKY